MARKSKQPAKPRRKPVFVARSLPALADMLSSPDRAYETALKRPTGARFEAYATEDGTEGVIEIYDVIGSFETNFRTINDTLKRLEGASRITVRINSPGGLVFDGFAIYNALRAHGAHIRVEVMGLAASAASIVTMAGDEIAVAENGFIMIHNASVLAWGNAREMRKQADVLAQIDKAIVRSYAQRTGMPASKLSDMLDAETWLDAEQAIDMKFADEVLDPVENSALALDVSAYAKAPGVLVKASRAKPAASTAKKGVSAPAAADWSAVLAHMDRLLETLKRR